MEFSRANANRVLPTERTSHSKHPLPTTQEKTLHMDITRWPTLKWDGWYSLQPKMEKLYRVSKNKTGSWLWLRSWTPYCQESKVTQLCLTLCDLMDCSLQEFSVHGIFQARVLEWVAISFSSLIAKFRLKLKNVGKSTRPFRYDLNQISYDYTVEVRNRFKGLDLIDGVPDELWRFMTLYRRWEQYHP